MILYFSGTGNSAYVARRIAKEVSEPLYNIGEAIKRKKRARAGLQERLIFVVPTYAWRIPKLVEEWIAKSDFAAGHKAYFVLTCGAEIGNAGKYAQKLCQAKGLEYMGCGEVVMPENYVAMFPVPGEEEARKVIREAEPAIERIILAVQKGEKLQEKKAGLGDRVKSSLVNQMFYPLFVHDHKFYAKDSCISCGKCVQVCPLQDIRLKDGKPVWGNRCTHCMACICGCPAQAIEYGKISVGKPRYRCPYE